MFKFLQFVLITIIFVSPIIAQDGSIPGIPSNIERGKLSNEELQTRREEQANKDKLIAQRKVVLEQILVDIGKLELPEERARFLSSAGKQFCKEGDKGRAVELFELATKEFHIARNRAENIREKNSEGLIYGGVPRMFIIQDINDCDEDLAYEYLVRTRPKILSDTLVRFYKNPVYSNLDKKIIYVVSWEISRETNLKSEIIRRKSNRAEEFIKQDLQNNISNNTLGYLESLYRKNPTLANSLTEKVVQKLLTMQMYDIDKKPIFITYPANIQIAVSFLKALGKDEPNERYKMRISDELLIKLADKVSNDILESKYDWVEEYALKTIQRLFPNRFAQIEQMKADKIKTPEAIERQKYNELKENDAAVEELLFDAGNFSEPFQQKIYKLAVCKLVEQEQFNQAGKLFAEKSTDKSHINKRLSLIFYANVIKILQEKNYEQAEKIIRQMPDPQLRIDALAFLARQIYYKDRINNKQKALSLLSDALTEFDLNSAYINQSVGFGNILSVYSLVETDMAFPMFNLLINTKSKSNDNGETYSKYADSEDMREISFYIYNNNDNYSKIISNLRKRDFEKTLEIINKIEQPRTRIYLKLDLLEANNSSDFFLERVERFCNP